MNLLNRSNRRQQWLLESRPPRPPTSGASQQPVPSPCYRCGAPHSPSTCKFKTSTCYYCKKQGHLASVCRRKIRDLESAPRNSGQPYNRHLEAATDDSGDIVHSLYYSTAKRPKPIEVAVTLSEAETTMEVDTGATLSVMSEETYKRLWDRDTRPPLQPSTTQLTTYTGEKIFALGVINVHVSYQHQNQQLQLLIVPGKGPLLLGRDWLQHIHLDWPSINLLRTDPNAHLQQVLAKYPTIFRDELGHIREVTATFHVVDTTQQPRFFRARPVPYSLRTKVEAELTRLQDKGVISPVQFSDWAAPIVPVVKSDGSVRICGDYKLTINVVSKTDAYPLPRIEDIFASLAGGKYFTKLDLAHAYQQVPLADVSKPYTTINTHKGLFQYNRLPFGVASAPAIFQRTMDSLLQGLPHTCVYLDDILITGTTDETHIQTLDKVLHRINEAGIRLKREKCSFMLPSVEYLGHKISSSGLQPTDEKIRALKDAPVPRNESQLKSFLGLLNYYGKFVPHLSTLLAITQVITEEISLDLGTCTAGSIRPRKEYPDLR